MSKKPKTKDHQNKLYNHIYKILVAVTAVVILIVAFAVSSTFTEKQLPNNDILTVKLYFTDPSDISLLPETREISKGTNKEEVKSVLEELMRGPNNTLLTHSVPYEIVTEATITGDNVDVYMTDEYNNLTKSEEILLRSSLVWTLTGLDSIKSVTLFSNGKQLTRNNGQAYGALTRNDVVIEKTVSPEIFKQQTITLYFADSQRTGLVAETRKVMINPNQPKEKYILEQLIKGPDTPGLVATVPQETKIKNIDIKNEEGVCHVDLSSDFVTKHPGGETQELLTIYSIVNSLTEDTSIKKVQFLIEGEKQEKFKGYVSDFSNPFERKAMEPIKKAE